MRLGRRWRLNKLLAGRKHLNSNDCWCDAISIATGQSYDDVYAIFKPMLCDNGGLDSRIIEGYLVTKGFACVEVSGTNVKEGLRFYDSTHNAVVFSVQSHSVAIQNNKVCEPSGTLEIFDMELIKVFWKERQ